MEAPNEQLVIRKRKLESWANEDPLFDEEMTVPINNGEPISNDDQSIYPIVNAKSELSIKRHSDAGDVSPLNSANFVSSYLKFPSSVQKTDEVMNSAGVFAGHVAMGIMAGATDMFKTALASRTDTVKYEVTQKSSVEHVEVSQSNTKYFNFGISFYLLTLGFSKILEHRCGPTWR